MERNENLQTQPREKNSLSQQQNKENEPKANELQEMD